MGGKSKSSQSQQTSNSQYSQVNDGDFAGAQDFTIDESDNSIEDSYNTTNELSIEDSYNQTYNYTDESDNSFNYTDESDNSMNVDDSFNTTNNYEFEDNSDNSVDNSQYFEDNREIDQSQTFIDESDNSQYFEDNRNIDNSVDNSQYFEDNSDRSQTFIDESDNSQYYEDNSDNSVDNSQYFEDNSDRSQTFVDESDNSITNSGDFAGVNGNISILDGGAVEEAFNFASEVNAQGNATAREAINVITDNAANTLGVATDAITTTANESILSTERTASNSLNAMFASLQESLGFGRDSITALQNQSDSYAAALSANVDEFSETLEEVTRNAISNAGSQVTASNQANALQLETIAALAESTATGGASSLVEGSTTQVKYLAVAVAVGLAALAFK